MFKNHEEYKKMRDELIAEAQTAMESGDNEGFDAKTKEVEALDAQFENFAQKMAELNALQNSAVKGPATMMQSGNSIGMTADSDMEYRKSFMNHVLRGTPILHNTGDETTVSTDVGAVIPKTILNRIVEQVESNGNILAKVTRTHFKGGVAVPTSAAKPTASWVAERGDVDSFAKTTGSVTFSYYKLKVKVAVSLIVDNVTLEVFERTLADNISEAMTRALEDAIINGRGSSYNEPRGILIEDVPSGQTIQATGALTYADLVAAEAALPSAYENGAEWVMHKKTFFNQIIGMVDSNGHPIARVDHGLDGKVEYRILGRIVNLTDHISSTIGSSYATLAFIINLKDYMINTNMGVTVSRYTDEDTDDKVTKAIMLADGKLIDTRSLVAVQLKNS